MDNRENPPAITSGPSGLRRLGILVGGLGLGAVLTYLLSKTLGGRKEESLRRSFPDQPVDDRGTGQDEAAQILLQPARSCLSGQRRKTRPRTWPAN